MAFQLHPQLAKDCEFIADFSLSRALLLNDSRYHWVILVPRKEGLSEVYQLDDEDQLLLMKESNTVLQRLGEEFSADKMNVAALGNMVPQLHVHHIVRYSNDDAWPKPVWGLGQAQPYVDELLDQQLDRLRDLFADLTVH